MPTRRRFLQLGAALAATVNPRPVLGNQANKNSRLRILQIGVGGIGQLDRRELASHPMVEFTGFCDVDSNWLAEYSKPYPDAFKVTDYREAFAQHAEKFDAVVIDTPDFHHAPMLITALQNHKHVYGQKPLVQQLDELRLVRNALRKRPDCVTQMGNQRATNEGRLKAIEMLRKNQLGRPLHAHVWTGMMERGSHMPGPWSKRPEPQPIPSHYDWDLWHGPLTRKLPFSDEIAPSRWRGSCGVRCSQCHLWVRMTSPLELWRKCIQTRWHDSSPGASPGTASRGAASRRTRRPCRCSLWRTWSRCCSSCSSPCSLNARLTPCGFCLRCRL